MPLGRGRANTLPPGNGIDRVGTLPPPIMLNISSKLRVMLAIASALSSKSITFFLAKLIPPNVSLSWSVTTRLLVARRYARPALTLL